MELGTFTKNKNDNLTGTVTTLLTSFEIEYRKIEKVGDGPDYRVYRKDTDIEVGMARIAYSKRNGKQYLNTLVDTPEFTQGLWLALVQEDDTTFVMKWTRSRKKTTGKANNANAPAKAVKSA